MPAAWFSWVVLFSCVLTVWSSTLHIEFGRYTANSDTFMQNCPVTCFEGYHRFVKTVNATHRAHSPLPTDLIGTYDAQFWSNETLEEWQSYECKKCNIATDVNNAALPSTAYVMQPDCTPECLKPYYNRPSYPTQCVLCDTICPVGQYLHGDACDTCSDCVSVKHGPGWVFTSHGILDNNLSCSEQCSPGMFADISIINSQVVEICRAHTEIECNNNTQFKEAGTAHHDAYCVDCEIECEGMHRVRACTPIVGPQMLCQQCEIEYGSLREGETWVGSSCARKCTAMRVRNQDTNECELCDHQCNPGYYFSNDRKHCHDCAPCTNKPDKATYIVNCEWICDDYHQFNVTSGTCESTTQPVPAVPPIQRYFDLTTRCSSSEYLTLSGCQPCETIVPSDGEGVKWKWTSSQTRCSWECLPGYYAFSISSQSWWCYTWQEYLKMVDGVGTDATVADATFTQRRRTAIPMLSEWQLLTISVALIFTALYTFS